MWYNIVEKVILYHFRILLQGKQLWLLKYTSFVCFIQTSPLLPPIIGAGIGASPSSPHSILFLKFCFDGVRRQTHTTANFPKMKPSPEFLAIT